MIARWRKAGLPVDERRTILAALTTRYLKYAAPVLLEALSHPDPRIRETAALSLGEGLFESAVDPLLRLVAVEKDRLVVAAAIQSLGVLGDEKALATLTRLAAEPAYARAVAFAAARIGGKGGGEILDGIEATHTGPGEEAAEMRKLLVFLRSDEFLAQEEAMRKIRERRLK